MLFSLLAMGFKANIDPLFPPENRKSFIYFVFEFGSAKQVSVVCVNWFLLIFNRVGALRVKWATKCENARSRSYLIDFCVLWH